jgi:hypothetical protein
MEKITEIFEKIVKIFDYLKIIHETARKHPVAALAIVLIPALYLWAYYYVNIYPKHVIYNIFSYINGGNYQDALNSTSLQFQKVLERHPGQKLSADEFALLYKTTELNRINRLTIDGDDWFLLNILSDTRTYELEYETVDVFRKEDFLDPIQERNQMWARIYYSSKVKDILSKPNPTADDNVRIRRRWKCKVTVKAFSERWKIQSYHAKEIALIYD